MSLLNRYRRQKDKYSIIAGIGQKLRLFYAEYLSSFEAWELRGAYACFVMYRDFYVLP